MTCDDVPRQDRGGMVPTREMTRDDGPRQDRPLPHSERGRVMAYHVKIAGAWFQLAEPRESEGDDTTPSSQTDRQRQTRAMMQHTEANTCQVT